MLAEYSNRSSYLLSIGRPAARIAIYYPTTSGWLGDFEANRSALAIARALLERQRDFDFIDEDALRSGVEVVSGALRNQWPTLQHGYRAVGIGGLLRGARQTQGDGNFRGQDSLSRTRSYNVRGQNLSPSGKM